MDLCRRLWGDDLHWPSGIGDDVRLGYHIDYLRVLSYMAERGEAYFPNQSVNGLLNRLMSIDTGALEQSHI